MDTPRAWLLAAGSSLDAARRLLGDHPRSSVSRAYYAAHAAAHALLIKAGQSPRLAEGTWTHKELPHVVRAVLARGSGPGNAVVSLFKAYLEECRTHRENADYAPLRTVDNRVAQDACRKAGQFVYWTRGVVNQ